RIRGEVEPALLERAGRVALAVGPPALTIWEHLTRDRRCGLGLDDDERVILRPGARGRIELEGERVPGLELEHVLRVRPDDHAGHEGPMVLVGAGQELDRTERDRGVHPPGRIGSQGGLAEPVEILLARLPPVGPGVRQGEPRAGLDRAVAQLAEHGQDDVDAARASGHASLAPGLAAEANHEYVRPAVLERDLARVEAILASHGLALASAKE